MCKNKTNTTQHCYAIKGMDKYRSKALYKPLILAALESTNDTDAPIFVHVGKVVRLLEDITREVDDDANEEQRINNIAVLLNKYKGV